MISREWSRSTNSAAISITVSTFFRSCCHPFANGGKIFQLWWSTVGIFSRRMRRPIRRVPPETLAAFSSYSWPGNIRELQNLVERAVILARDGVLPNPLPTAVVPIAPSPPTPTTSRDPEPVVPRTLRDSERALILQTLETTGWRIGGPKGAAVRLGLNRTTLMFRMRKLGIERPWGRPTPTSGFVSA